MPETNILRTNTGDNKATFKEFSVSPATLDAAS